MKSNKLIATDASTLFLFGYGLIVQAVAFPIIYFFITHYLIKASVEEAFVFLWYCVPVVAVFSVIVALIQISKRRTDREKYKMPLIGLILNLVWLSGDIVAICLIWRR